MKQIKVYIMIYLIIISDFSPIHALRTDKHTLKSKKSPNIAQSIQKTPELASKSSEELNQKIKVLEDENKKIDAKISEINTSKKKELEKLQNAENSQNELIVQAFETKINPLKKDLTTAETKKEKLEEKDNQLIDQAILGGAVKELQFSKGANLVKITQLSVVVFTKTDNKLERQKVYNQVQAGFDIATQLLNFKTGSFYDIANGILDLAQTFSAFCPVAAPYIIIASSIGKAIMSFWAPPVDPEMQKSPELKAIEKLSEQLNLVQNTIIHNLDLKNNYIRYLREVEEILISDEEKISLIVEDCMKNPEQLKKIANFTLAEPKTISQNRNFAKLSMKEQDQEYENSLKELRVFSDCLNDASKKSFYHKFINDVEEASRKLNMVYNFDSEILDKSFLSEVFMWNGFSEYEKYIEIFMKFINRIVGIQKVADIIKSDLDVDNEGSGENYSFSSLMQLQFRLNSFIERQKEFFEETCDNIKDLIQNINMPDGANAGKIQKTLIDYFGKCGEKGLEFTVIEKKFKNNQYDSLYFETNVESDSSMDFKINGKSYFIIWENTEKKEYHGFSGKSLIIDVFKNNKNENNKVKNCNVFVEQISNYFEGIVCIQSGSDNSNFEFSSSLDDQAYYKGTHEDFSFVLFDLKSTEVTKKYLIENFSTFDQCDDDNAIKERLKVFVNNEFTKKKFFKLNDNQKKAELEIVKNNVAADLKKCNLEFVFIVDYEAEGKYSALRAKRFEGWENIGYNMVKELVLITNVRLDIYYQKSSLLIEPNKANLKEQFQKRCKKGTGKKKYVEEEKNIFEPKQNYILYIPNLFNVIGLPDYSLAFTKGAKISVLDQLNCKKDYFSKTYTNLLYVVPNVSFGSIRKKKNLKKVNKKVSSGSIRKKKILKK